MQRATIALLLALLAFAGAPPGAAARPLARSVGRTLAQFGTTTWNVEWDVVYVPYPRVEALCGDLVTFRWSGSKAQTVALVDAPSDAAALARCSTGRPLTEPATTGEHTEELLQPGVYYFAEPGACRRGQILVVDVTCNEAPAASVPSTPAASPAPAPAGTIAAASIDPAESPVASPVGVPTATAPAPGASAEGEEAAPAGVAAPSAAPITEEAEAPAPGPSAVEADEPAPAPAPSTRVGAAGPKPAVAPGKRHGKPHPRPTKRPAKRPTKRPARHPAKQGPADAAARNA